MGYIEKIEPAPLPNGGKGGYLSMGSNDGSKGLSKKHDAEMNALNADFEAKKAKLEHKHEQERMSKKAQPIKKPGQVSAKVKGPNMSKYPKGK